MFKGSDLVMKSGYLQWLAVFFITLTGCALTTDRTMLQYNQQAGIAPIQSAKNVSVNVQVTDQRQDKSKISSKKNGFGMEMAPIVATEDVAITVRRAFEAELLARGFQLGSEAALVKILADVTRFYNDFKTGFFAGDAVAELNMSVSVKSQNGEMLYLKQVAAQGVEPNIQLMTGENARRALNRALENGMRDIFEDQTFISALMASKASKTISK